MACIQFGLIDPSDGIEYRQPVLSPDDEYYPYRSVSDRCIYRRCNKWRVRIKFHQVTINLGSFIEHRDARRARDLFYAKVYGPQWREILHDRSSKRRGNGRFVRLATRNFKTIPLCRLADQLT